MSELASIRPFTKADLSAITAIADDRLGENYLDLNELSTYLKNSNKIGVVALLNGEIAGFALAQMCDQNELLSLVLCEHDWFREQFLNKYPVGVLKTIAVQPQFSNLGIGTALTKYRVDLLKKSTNSILAVSWEHDQSISNKRILEKSGLIFKQRIENYWTKDSILKGYSCKQCGAPPCKCAAMIYMM